MSAVLGILALAEKIVLTRWLRAPDQIEVTVDRRRPYASQLKLNKVLFLPRTDFSAPLAFLIEARAYSRDTKKKQLTLYGRTLDGFALTKRLAWPSPADYPLDTAGYDSQTSVHAETAFKHFIDANAGPGAVAARRVPGFAVATDAGLGLTGSWATRYQALLDVAQEICFAADMGWETIYDPATGLHTIDIIVPVDRSDSVRLSFEAGTITKWDENESQGDSVTLAVVAGQGEGVDRDIVIRPSVEPTGFDRREGFKDARDVALGATTLLQQRGDAILAAGGPTRGIAVVVRQGTRKYPTDYQLGDYVLAFDRETDVNSVSQVIGVKITIERSAAVPTIEPILDKPAAGTTAPSMSFAGGRIDSGTVVSGGGGGLTNLDGGGPDTVYGGTTAVDGGAP